jgi:polysaccharide biosynthesis protein PslG
MERSLSRRAIATILALVMVLLAACSPQAAAPGSQEQGAPADPTRTLRPTFTPEPTEPEPALAPTVTPPPAENTAEPASSTPEKEPTEEPTTPTAEPTTPAPTVPPAKSLRMGSPEYGMQAFLWWRPEVASRDLQVIRDAGFGWVKVGFGWRDIEGAAKGAYDWSRTDLIVQLANEVGLDIVVRIDHQPQWAGGNFPVNGPPDNYQDLADFLYAVADRYRGRIRAYEVWNEPNLAREWGGQLPDPGRYVELLRLSYTAIKRGDPGAMVISAGLSPTGTWNEASRPDDWYLESMYIAMGDSSDGYFDVLGAHGAGYKSPPEIDPAEVAANPDLGGHRAFAFRRVEDLRAIMERYGDADKQIALLEFGWTSDPRPESPYNWHAVSEETKADYLVGAYQYARQHWSPWIGLMSLIYIADPDWTPDNEQYWWAITEPSYPTFVPRPAYTALKDMVK